MNDINEMPPKCQYCPYWEVCEYPWVCPTREQLATNLKQTCHATDTISRKAAIDAIADDMPQAYTPDGSHPADECIFMAQEIYADCIQTLKDLPSAQPERTCVNCGRTINNGGWYADGRTRCPIEEHYALPKDGFCHLWEKRNNTDDDYPVRRTDE